MTLLLRAAEELCIWECHHAGADVPRLPRQAKEMEAANAEMQRHAHEVDEQCRALEAQAADFHGRWRATAAENERLQSELAKLRDALAVRAAPHLCCIWAVAGSCMCATPHCELNRRAVHGACTCR